MKRNKLIVSSLLATLMSLSLIGGATYSLFTSESNHDISVSSAKVDISSIVKDGSLELYSFDQKQDGMHFANGGTATLDNQTGKLDLKSMTPGDAVKFKIQITNNSNVRVKYRVKVIVNTTEFQDKLIFTGDGVEWTDLEVGSPMVEKEYTLTFDKSANNDFQDKNAEVQIVVEAHQHNDPALKDTTISFVSNEGTAVAPITKTNGVSVKEPTPPTRNYYTFAGWYDNPEFSGTKYIFSKMPTENITLYAKWTPNDIKVTYHLNGGKFSVDKESIDIPYTHKVLENLDTPTKTGHSFVGWYTTDTFKDDSKVDAETTMPESPLNVYAKWSANSYNVNFVLNDGVLPEGTPSPYSKVFGQEIGELPTPTKTGYSFTSWCKDEQLQEAYDVHTLMPVDSFTVYAKWTINSYTISFNSNEGSPVNDITQNYNTEVLAPTSPTKTGYTFAGWYKEAGLVNEFTFPSTMPSESITLYAKWQPNKYKIIFDSNGGSEVATINQDFNTDITPPANPTQTGHTFAGWYKEADLINKYTFPSKMPAESVTVYADWTINSYTITFISNSGSSVDQITQNYDSPVIAPDEPTRTGYTFGGWYDNDQFTGNAYTFTTMPAENITLYAKWTINSYTISFNSNEGSDVNDITQNYGTTVTKPTDPTRTGYDFKGWYKDPGLTEAYTFTTMPAGNITLYAKWKEATRFVFYITNGGTKIPDQTLKEGSTLQAPKPPTKEGFTFGGWYSDDGKFQNEITFPYVIGKENVFLYAKWNVIPVEFVLNTDGKSYKANKIKNQCLNWKRIEIPSTYNGLPVTAIGKSFLGKANDSIVKEFVLPESITTIDDSAFSNNRSIEKINIPSKVTVLNDNVFDNCSNLKTVTLHDNITSIGTRCFYQTTSLNTIKLPSKLNVINVRAFSRSGLTSLSIPATVTEIKDSAFAITNLGTVTFEERGSNGINIYGKAFESILNTNFNIRLPQKTNLIGVGHFSNSKGTVTCPASLSEKISGTFDGTVYTY